MISELKAKELSQKATVILHSLEMGKIDLHQIKHFLLSVQQLSQVTPRQSEKAKIRAMLEASIK